MKFTINYQSLVSGIFVISTIFLIFGFASATEQNNEELIKSAMNFLKTDQIDEAIPILEKVLKTEPNNLNVLKNLAVAYTNSKMCHDSIQIYDKILELKPNSPEILYGKAVCFNNLGLPEKSLLTLDKIDKKYSSNDSILLTKANSHMILREFIEAEKYYQTVLEKNPDNELSNLNMLILSYHMKNHNLSEKYLVKILGDNPKGTSYCDASGCMGKVPFLFPIEDSENYQITAQIQVRTESNQLIGIIETEKITYTPHPIFKQILLGYDVVETIQNDLGTFEVKRIIEKTEPRINSYFMDRVEFFYDDYTVLFGYNLAIPLESGDYIITEWMIQKKIL